MIEDLSNADISAYTYADDLEFTAADTEGVKYGFQIIDRWCDSRNMKTNPKKSDIIFFGNSKKQMPDNISNLFKERSLSYETG